MYAGAVYSLRDEALIEEFAGLEYGSCCWKLRAVYRQYVSSRTGERDSSIAVQLELSGLSSVGVPADAFLEGAIRDTPGPARNPNDRQPNRMRNQAFCALLLSSIALQAGAQTRDLATSGVLLDRVAAVVNEGVVLESELNEQVTLVTRRLQQNQTQLPPTNVLRQQILERLVVQEVQLQRAERAGIKVPDEVLNDSLKDVAKRNDMTLDQLPRALEAQGVNYAAYRDSMRKEMTIQMLRQRDVLARIIVTPREIDQYLEKQQNDTENREYNVSHILLSLPEAASPGQLEEVQARATDIVKRAREGEDFAQLAVSYSNSQTALEGGQLGWRKGAQLPTFIADLAVGMQPGQVSDPVRTPSGFHIVRLNDQRGAEQQSMVNQTHVRHILMHTNELQDDETVKQKLNALRTRILAGEDFAASRRSHSEDAASASGRRRPRPGRRGHDRAGVRTRDAGAGIGCDQISEPVERPRCTPDQVRSYSPGACTRRPRLRHRTQPAIHARGQSRRRNDQWVRRLRDEAYVEYLL